MALLELMSAEFIAKTGTGSAESGWSGGSSYTNCVGVRGNRICHNVTTGIQKTFPSVLATSGTVTIGFAMASNLFGDTGSHDFFYANIGGTGAFRLNTINGTIRLGDTSGTTVATSAAVVTAGTPSGPFFYFEVQYAPSGTATSTITVKVNGTTILTGSYVIGQASNTINQLVIGSTGVGTFYGMDYYVLDSTGSVNTTFLGDCRVECLWPTATGANDTWSLGLGGGTTATTKTQAMSDPYASDGDNSYIRTANPGDRQTFVLGDLGSTTGTVKGVKVATVGRGENSGGQKLSGTLRISTTNYDGTDYALLGNNIYGPGKMIRDTSPATSAAFTATEINGMEAGPLVLA